MSKLSKQPDELQQALFKRLFEAAKVAAMNDIDKHKYISAMNTERDIRNQISYAMEKGMEKGMKKGMEKGRIVGREEGIKQGREDKRIEILELLRKNGYLTEEIETLLCEPAEEYKRKE